MRLNYLSGSAWAKLTKNVWIPQKLLKEIKNNPVNQNTPLYVLSKPSTFRKTNTMTSINETYVKLIELFSNEHRIVFDPFMTNNAINDAVIVSNRQFVGSAAHPGIIIQDSLNFSHGIGSILLERDADIPTFQAELMLTECPLFDFKQGSLIDYDEHLQRFVDTIKRYYQTHLKQNGYLVIVTTDQRYQSRYYAPHITLCDELERCCATLQGIVTILNERQKLKAYGYPTTFVPNIVNQHALILRKI